MAAEKILTKLLKIAETNLDRKDTNNPEIYNRLKVVCESISNRACVRFLMACLLAKLDNVNVDPRKPYTEIKSSDAFSGRSYDEQYLAHFINSNRLPCNQTTAFLTPGFRKGERTLTRKNVPIGRPRELYIYTIELLDDVYKKRVTAKALLTDAIRLLIRMREENKQRIDLLLKTLQSSEAALPLSSEQIITLVEQHLRCKNSSRLPVLIVAAAYSAAEKYLKEKVRTLKAHNAADFQTGAVGDVEICLADDNNVITAYEMKTNIVTSNDIDAAVLKIAHHPERIGSYIFVTTQDINREVFEYAKTFYDKTGGTEISILDCIGFLRHFLHLFHRIRMTFLDKYQKLVLDEPDSAIGHPLKEALLALRHSAESE